MKERKFFSGLWRFLKRKATGAEDTDLGAARRILVEIAEKKDAMSDEEIAAKVDEVQGMTADLPESDDKGKLVRFLEDFKQSKQMDSAAVSEAAEMIATLFEELDTSAMAEVTGVGVTEEPAVEEPAAIEEPQPMTQPAPEEPAPMEKAIEEVTPEDGQTGSTTLTEPSQYVPGTTAVGEDGCSDEAISQMLSGLKGKKISPKQAIYILQELLASEEGTSEEVAPPAEESAPTAEKPAPEELPAKEEPEEEPTMDSFGITATISKSGNHNDKSLAAFFGENFGIKERS